MAILRKNCILDPGAYTFRIYNPKTNEITRIRSAFCKAGNRQLCGTEAIEASISGEGGELRFPWSQGKAFMDIEPLFERLMKESKADQYDVKPSLQIIAESGMDEKEKSRLQRMAVNAGFRKISFVNTMELISRDFSLCIHAGHSCTEIGVYRGRKPVLYKKIIYGAQQMDEAIMDFIGSRYRALVFAEDAAALRMAASKAFSENRNPILSCTALDQSGQYVRISFPAYELWPVMKSVLDQIVLWVKSLIAQKGPDLMDRILRHPVILSGGLSECFGLRQMLEEQLHAPVTVLDGGEDSLILAAKRKLF